MAEKPRPTQTYARCPCGHDFPIPSHYVGREVKCPRCGAKSTAAVSAPQRAISYATPLPKLPVSRRALVGGTVIATLLIAGGIVTTWWFRRTPPDRYLERTRDFYYSLVQLDSDLDTGTTVPTVRSHLAASKVEEAKWLDSLGPAAARHASAPLFGKVLDEFELGVEYGDQANDKE